MEMEMELELEMELEQEARASPPLPRSRATGRWRAARRSRPRSASGCWSTRTGKTSASRRATPHRPGARRRPRASPRATSGRRRGPGTCARAPRAVPGTAPAWPRPRPTPSERTSLSEGEAERVRRSGETQREKERGDAHWSHPATWNVGLPPPPPRSVSTKLGTGNKRRGTRSGLSRGEGTRRGRAGRTRRPPSWTACCSARKPCAASRRLVCRAEGTRKKAFFI